jgi:hypothetical protein
MTPLVARKYLKNSLVQSYIMFLIPFMLVCPICGKWVSRAGFIMHFVWSHIGASLVTELSRVEPECHMLLREAPVVNHDDMCPICWSGQGEAAGHNHGLFATLRQCGHTFCASCIRKWWQRHSTCPVCMHQYAILRPEADDDERA